jgi:hypothetical protein
MLLRIKPDSLCRLPPCFPCHSSRSIRCPRICWWSVAPASKGAHKDLTHHTPIISQAFKMLCRCKMRATFPCALLFWQQYSWKDPFWPPSHLGPRIKACFPGPGWPFPMLDRLVDGCASVLGPGAASASSPHLVQEARPICQLYGRLILSASIFHLTYLGSMEPRPFGHPTAGPCRLQCLSPPAILVLCAVDPRA